MASYYVPGESRRSSLFLLTATGHFLLASLSALYVTEGADNIAAVWPPSGYFLALLLLMPARARIAAFAGMVTASMGANMLGGTPLWTSITFTLSNAGEASLALWLLRRRETGELSFMVPRSVANFCFAAFIASCGERDPRAGAHRTWRGFLPVAG